ncbi:MAG: hypothetical protein RLZZ422_819 [Pseudomonadota bacterium]|jgi:uncharacterized membrane protein
MSVALALHVLAIVIWVGGMFFAYMALRPVTSEQLGAPVRLTLWAGVFKRFFPWVIVSIGLILASGYWMVFVPFGGMANTPVYVHIMQLLGLIMMAIFGHLYFAPFKRLKYHLVTQNWEAAGAALNQMRLLIGINLGLGVVTTLIGAGGKYWV